MPWNLRIPCLLHRIALGELEDSVHAHNDVDADDAKPEQPEVPLLNRQSKKRQRKGSFANRDSQDHKEVAHVEALQGDDQVVVVDLLDMTADTVLGGRDNDTAVCDMENL